MRAYAVVCEHTFFNIMSYYVLIMGYTIRYAGLVQAALDSAHFAYKAPKYGIYAEFPYLGLYVQLLSSISVLLRALLCNHQRECTCSHSERNSSPMTFPISSHTLLLNEAPRKLGSGNEVGQRSFPSSPYLGSCNISRV